MRITRRIRGRYTAVSASLLMAVGLSMQAMAGTPVNISLEEVVGGGDGSGTVLGNLGEGINPATGSTVSGCFFGITGVANNVYNPVPTSKYIDGVFIPDGGNGTVEVQVSSDLHTVTGIGSAANGTWDYTLYEDKDNDACPLEYYAVRFGETASIRFHANNGITFDLNEFEADNPGHEASKFTALAGVAHADGDGVVFSVVVDGVIKEGPTPIAAASSADIEVELLPGDRFLTLIVTDGGNSYSADQFMLGDPTLTLNADVTKPEAVPTIPFWATGLLAFFMIFVGLLHTSSRQARIRR